MSQLVGLGFTTSNAKTGERIQANATINGGTDLNFTGATTGPGYPWPAGQGFLFANVGVGPGSITLTAPGFKDRIITGRFPEDFPANVDYKMEPSGSVGGPVQRVHVDGLGYKTADGQPWHGFSMTGFRDYQRFLSGEDIRPLLEQARSLGANMRRIFGMWGEDFQTNDGFGPFKPQNYPGYYDRLPAFAALLAEYGLWFEFTVFADTAFVMPNQSEQIQHFNRVCEKLRDCPGSFVELVNENNQHGNAVDIGAFTKPSGIAACSGSNGEGGNPTQPFWDFSNLHAERREERLGLTTSTVYFAINGYSEGADSWPGTHQATNNDEPGRTVDGFTAYQMGIGSRYGGWVTSHTRAGTQSILLPDDQANATRQMFIGAHGLEYQP